MISLHNLHYRVLVCLLRLCSCRTRIKKAVNMVQTTYTAIRVRFPESLAQDSKIRVSGELTRFCTLHSGRILSTVDNSFFLTDLEGKWVQQLLRICEVGGVVATVRLVSSAFFEKLFSGEVSA